MKVTSPPRRVVSLIASATEMVCAVGCEERLVGRSHECDVPASVRGLPACSEPRLDVERPGRDIDASVRSILEQALSVYRVDAGRLRALRPDLVITQTMCEVCAVSLRDVEAALGDWTGSRPALLALQPARLLDVWEDVERVAHALGVAERGRVLRRELEGRVQAIATRMVLADGHLFFNRPGPRLVESLEILAELLHPEECRFGHEGRGWRRMAR